MRTILMMLALTLFGCDEQVAPEPEVPDGGPPPEIIALDTEVVISLYREVKLRAFAIYDDSSWQDVTEDVEWSAECPASDVTGDPCDVLGEEPGHVSRVRGGVMVTASYQGLVDQVFLPDTLPDTH